MKFGGTSVGNACAIQKVVDIIRAALLESEVVVVVSAMGGVTNELLDAVTRSEVGDNEAVASIFDRLNRQHTLAASTLIRSPKRLGLIAGKLRQLLREGDRLCKDAILKREMTPPARDSLSSLGERLSAPLLAAALAERGVASEAVDATQLVVTDSCHGAAEPRMDATRERCQALLTPMLRRGLVPVVTGFIGATDDGMITTLGRGGSDYSATILGASLEADEIIIWTDVDGVLTADPRLVPDACTIPEISYEAATELAKFGAKVLHAKTLLPVTQREIPVWIRNTFAPQKPGTKITSTGIPADGEVVALSAMSNVALITVEGVDGVRDLLGRTLSTSAAVPPAIFLISQSSPQKNVRFIVPSALANRTVEALQRKFAQNLTYERGDHVNLDPTVAVVTLIGSNIVGRHGIMESSLEALNHKNIKLLAIGHGSSRCNVSFVVAQEDMKRAIAIVHRELGLGLSQNTLLSTQSA